MMQAAHTKSAGALYLRYLGVSLRSQLQYPASFWMLTFGHFLATGGEFLGIWVLFQRFGQVRGWQLPEVALFYGIANVAFSMAEAAARGFDTFQDLVRSGDFDRFLLRPRSTALQVAAREFQLMRVGRMAQGLVALCWSLASLHVAWTLPKALLLVGGILGGACIFSGLFVLQATLAFWTVETLEIMNTVTYGGVETSQYPLTIYRPWFRSLFMVAIPLACMNYFPLHAILGRAEAFGTPAIWHWTAPLIGVLFLAVSLRVWEFGVRHYCSTGS